MILATWGAWLWVGWILGFLGMVFVGLYGIIATVVGFENTDDARATSQWLIRYFLIAAPFMILGYFLLGNAMTQIKEFDRKLLPAKTQCEKQPNVVHCSLGNDGQFHPVKQK